MTENISRYARTCYLHPDAEAWHLLVQPVDEHDLELLEKEIEAIRSQTETPFSLAALLINDWNQELTHSLASTF